MHAYAILLFSSLELRHARASSRPLLVQEAPGGEDVGTFGTRVRCSSAQKRTAPVTRARAHHARHARDALRILPPPCKAKCHLKSLQSKACAEQGSLSDVVILRQAGAPGRRLSQDIPTRHREMGKYGKWENAKCFAMLLLCSEEALSMACWTTGGLGTRAVRCEVHGAGPGLWCRAPTVAAASKQKAGR